MATAPRILAFAASARRESLNRKFLAAAVAEVSLAGAQVTLLQPDEVAMPLYNGDLEDAEGMPPTPSRWSASWEATMPSSSPRQNTTR
jgi:NAD(P)H-dependent FMN reductase